MTDNEFNDLSLNKEVNDMDEDEARETLVEFMEAHAGNREAYDDLQAELDDVESDYREEIDELEETVSEFTERLAEEAEEYVNMPASLIADRFSLSEIDKIIEEAEGSEEFSEESEEAEDDDDRLTTFADREQKGKRESDDPPAKFRDEAKSALRQKWGRPE